MRINLTGQKFGRLTVIKFAGVDEKGRTMWECQCECGSLIIVRSDNLKRGISKSCGCFSREMASKRLKKYENTDHYLYKTWMGMKLRCESKSSGMYKYYGERGIKICDRWKNYDNFYNDMIGGYKKGLTIDRINCNGDYEPPNCRWATMTDQANNKSTTIYVTFCGETKPLAEMCRKYKADYQRTWKRLHRGWNIAKALLA